MDIDDPLAENPNDNLEYDQEEDNLQVTNPNKQADTI